MMKNTIEKKELSVIAAAYVDSPLKETVLKEYRILLAKKAKKMTSKAILSWFLDNCPTIITEIKKGNNFSSFNLDDRCLVNSKILNEL